VRISNFNHEDHKDRKAHLESVSNIEGQKPNSTPDGDTDDDADDVFPAALKG
jgi:hypothetical protein